MWVQPKFRQPIFSLKPIKATTYKFYYKNLRRRVVCFFFRSRKICSGSFYLQQKLFSINFFSAIRETEAVICAIQ